MRYPKSRESLINHCSPSYYSLIGKIKGERCPALKPELKRRNSFLVSALLLVRLVPAPISLPKLGPLFSCSLPCGNILSIMLTFHSWLCLRTCRRSHRLIISCIHTPNRKSVAQLAYTYQQVYEAPFIDTPAEGISIRESNVSSTAVRLFLMDWPKVLIPSHMEPASGVIGLPPPKPYLLNGWDVCRYMEQGRVALASALPLQTLQTLEAGTP